MKEPMEITENYIDIREVLRAKRVELPAFLVRVMERLLHVKELNRAIFRFRDKFGVDFAEAFVTEDLKVEVAMQGGENIPKDGSPIIAGNHPLGGPDGVAMICAVGRLRRDLKFPVNDFLMNLPGLRSIFVPVDKVHRNNANVEALENAFAGSNAMLFFPAGLCSRRIKGEIRDLEWKPTFIKKAIRYNRPIVPFFVGARNRGRFYFLANLRKILGVKFNFEMALLPGEMFAQRGKRFSVVVGKPVPSDFFDTSRTPHQWAAAMREYVYVLRDNPSLSFQEYCGKMVIAN